MTRLRPCEGCTVCCEVLAVEEMASPAGDRCLAQEAHGCGRYASRPASCRGFACGWAAGMVPRADRPDTSGVLCWMQGDELHLRELCPGALDGRWEARLRLWSVAFSCYVERASGGREVTGPSRS
jgi:hypothetical protein